MVSGWSLAHPFGEARGQSQPCGVSMVLKNAALAILVMFASVITVTGAANAMSLKECSTRYQAAKKAGLLNNRNWTEFRKAECPADTPSSATSEKAEAPAAKPTTTTANDKKPVPEINGKTDQAILASSASSAGNSASLTAEMPTAIDQKYATETPARGRLHTCADAYQAQKKAGSLNGLRWIQQGGGFYSLCTRKIKATSP